MPDEKKVTYKSNNGCDDAPEEGGSSHFLYGIPSRTKKIDVGGVHTQPNHYHQDLGNHDINEYKAMTIGSEGPENDGKGDNTYEDADNLRSQSKGCLLNESQYTLPFRRAMSIKEVPSGDSIAENGVLVEVLKDGFPPVDPGIMGTVSFCSTPTVT